MRVFPAPSPTVWPEARPLRLGDGDTGIVISHGFTGSVASVAPWARGLAEPSGEWPGARVVAPRLPGHGTSWQDLARTRWWDWYGAVEDAYLGLAAECSAVFVAGLSMGGALALRLASLHPVDGVLLVNPAVASRDRRIPVAARLRNVLPPQRGISSDIADPAQREPGYPRFSVKSLGTMDDLWRDTRPRLPRVSAPTLLLRSAQDHVVDDLSGELIRAAVPRVEERVLTRSYHVATMDYDRQRIIDESRRFILDIGAAGPRGAS
ncbi:alpha/beta hydrolase [Tessaracoccus flavus]|uniref:AB hydrolase-1 domain-containing protein n=1 Tax=Tessaracoccus flavus TaxID=1610493 RepID=A0A1Q2CD41_9ACTN|nr:alpha/beta fold hydrolase [Tessaracoccus flavus]AQP44042.1 hypothetical protein RPIT_03775 [Tessaracoccus flavus]SDY32996.1 carboxylesterase [Tessaracoccus flavus]